MSKELWSATAGARPHTVWVGELAEKDGDVYLRYYVGGKRKSQKTKIARVRDDRGRVAARRTQAAVQEAEEKVEELRRGLGKTTVRVAEETPPAPRPSSRSGPPRTLGEGVAVAFSLKGCFPLDPAEHKHTRVSKRLAEEFVQRLGGPQVTWEAITHGDVRALWREIERETRRDGGGHRRAEKMVTCFYTVCSWLATEYPHGTYPRQIKQWRGELKEYWRQSRNKKLDPHQPRHTPAEVERLFRHRDRADPRVRLAMVLGAELRGGQVIRTMRSNCVCEDGRWTIHVPYVTAKKAAPPVLLNEVEAAEFEAALDRGYLHRLEDAYQSGDIKDYAIFVAGQLCRGVAAHPKSKASTPLAERALRSISGTTLVHMFHKFERAAGVLPARGRGWHGLRRQMSDLGESGTGDERVKNALGGWAPGSTMRAKVYQDRVNDEVRRDASEVRALTRPGFAPLTGETVPTRDVALGPADLLRQIAGRPSSTFDEDGSCRCFFCGRPAASDGAVNEHEEGCLYVLAQRCVGSYAGDQAAQGAA